MIVHMTGKLSRIQPPIIWLEINGLSYEISIPMNQLHGLPALGESLSLHTHLSIKEDAHQLYGFNRLEEKIIFQDILKVSGIGAKTALAILSGLSIERLRTALTQKNTKLLSTIPGIGEKTAQRLALELSAKATNWVSELDNAQNVHLQSAFIQQLTHNKQQEKMHADAISALLSLGYSDKEAKKAVHYVLDLAQNASDEFQHELTLSDLIMGALKFFTK